MGRPKKSGPPARAQGILARNLGVLIKRRYPQEYSQSETAAFRKLAADAGTSLSQVQRAVSGTVAVGIDTLERLADHFDVRTVDLLTEGAFAERKPVPEASPGANGSGELQRRPG